MNGDEPGEMPGGGGPALAGGAGFNDRPANMLICALAARDGNAILSVSGELDLAAGPAFLGYLKRASDGGAHVVLDLSGLRYIDSTGINALLNAHAKFARTGRRIALAAVPPTIRRILGVVAVEDVIPVFPTVEAALESLRNPPNGQ